MKRILLATLMGGALISANAQTEPDVKPDVKKEETKSEPEKRDSIVFPTQSGKVVITVVNNSNDSSGKNTFDWKPSKPEPRDFWSGMDFGFNGYLNANGGTSAPTGFSNFDLEQGKSIYLGFNFFEKYVPIYKTHVGIITGLGMDYNIYRFNGTTNPLTGNDSNDITNRLKTFHVTVPLLLGVDFAKPGQDGLHFAAGVVTGIRFASYTKEKYTIGDATVKRNTRDDFNLNPFRVNAHARIGYGDFSLFASYSLTSMFRNNTGSPELYPFQVGISFGG